MTDKPQATGRPQRGRGSSRRAPHPAQGARIAAAGLGTAATLTLVGVMALDDRGDPNPVAPSTPNVVVVPDTVGGATDPAPPVQLDAEPSTRVQVGSSPTPLRVAPDATTSSSR